LCDRIPGRMCGTKRKKRIGRRKFADPTRTMRIHNIQLLRIVAAAAVVLMHLGHYAGNRFHASELDRLLGGSWACFPVPLFFAISGFVLTHAVRNSGTSLFLFGRALRLYPGFWLATIIVAAMFAANGGLPFLTQMRSVGWTLRPAEFGTRLYVLGIEWSLVFEATLSVGLAAMGAWRSRWVLPTITSFWLIVIAAKIALRPGSAMDLLPNWGTFFLSPLSLPFLLGSLTYHFCDRGKSLRWFVLAGLVVFLAIVPAQFESLEALWCIYGFASAAVTWLAVQFRQLTPNNPLVRAGDLSYGLYLVHVPLMLAGFAVLNHMEWLIGMNAGVLIVGCVAMGGGLLYGRLESSIHRRLKLVKWSLIAAACGRIARGAGSLPARLSGRFAGSR
jgi:exopolysaccharide production protein ExoZ